MKTEEIKQLKETGFSGFVTVERLNASKSIIPDVKGVYVVLRKVENSAPEFLAEGSGPRYHGSTPMNYPVAQLQGEWVDDTSIVYIGKTDSSLRKRISTYLRFGNGADAAHRGGRAIWQLPDSSQLVFAWKALPPFESAESLESTMIQLFKMSHNGQRPFANMRD